MRVLFLNDLDDPRIGSSVRQMYQHAARLRELGHEAAVVSATQDRAAAGETAIEGTPVHRIYSDYPVRFRAWVALDNRAVRGPLAEVLTRFRPDVVHSHLLHTHLSYASLTAARRAGAAVVFTAHDVMTFCYQKLTCFHGGEAHGGKLRDYRAYAAKCIPCQRLRFRPGRNRAIRRVLERDVHRLTVVSDELGTVLRANGIRVDRTVHNAIRPRAELPDDAAVAAFRERFALEGAQVVTIGGRLHEQKGVGQLLRMVRRLGPELPGLRLLVMGRREVYEREFAALARELGVAVIGSGRPRGAWDDITRPIGRSPVRRHAPPRTAGAQSERRTSARRSSQSGESKRTPMPRASVLKSGPTLLEATTTGLS